MIGKTIRAVIALAILALAVFVLLQTARHPKINNLRAAFKQKSDIVFDNLEDSVSPQRRQPLTTIELEETLKLNLPVPFTGFNQDDWQWFWQLCYGAFTQDSGDWPKRKSQLSRQEIQNILSDSYKPFERFSEQQWNIFWQHVLKGRVFKK